ncbi:AAA family ATPase [Vibrio vulnificus]|nr:AAA family ATPase [Vibrio vulnificus]
MIINQFKDEVLKLAKQQGSEIAYLTHAAKVLLTVFEEARIHLVNANSLIDVNEYEKLINNQLARTPKLENVSPKLSPSVDSIIRGSIVASGSSANVTELHLLIEFICNVIDNEGDDLVTLAKACEAPLELRTELKAMLGGETIENLEKESGDSKIKRGYTELASPFTDPLIGNKEQLIRLKDAVNKSGGSIIAVVGEKRIGKTTLIESLNHWIHNSDENISKTGIYTLDTTEIINTSMHRGVLEQCLSSAIQDSKSERSILLIDNIHYLNDACRDPEFMPFLASAADQGVVIICTLTPDAYSMVFDKRGYRNSVLRIDLKEPSKDVRQKILRHHADKISNLEHVIFDNKAINALSELGETHFRTNTLHNSIEVLERSAIKHDADIVTKRVITEVVASVKGVPLDTISNDLANKLKTLSKNIKAELFGQDHAVDEICEQIQLSTLGFKVKDKQPKASFMLLGGSGVGKTETTEILARELGVETLVLDMGEYKERHTVSKLLGAPPGYIGHDKGDGILAEFIAKNPDGIVLFDEIEKADPQINDLLLGVLDKGRLTTNTQKEIDLTGNIIFFTSNCGADGIGSSKFGLLGKKEEKATVDRSAFEKAFKPEFRNRLTKIIDYKTLDEDDLVKIALKSVNKITTKAKTQYGLTIDVSEEVIRHIANHYYKIDMGARPIEKGVETEIGTQIGSAILNSNKTLRSIKFFLNENKVTYTTN